MRLRLRLRLGSALLGLLVASGVVACAGSAGPEKLELRSVPATVGEVPPAPVPGRILNAAVWTGGEMLVWGGVGSSPGEGTAELRDGAAYDPVAGHWRVLAPSPLSARAGVAAVWAGDRWFLWGGSRPYSSAGEVLDDGASYDPATDSWTVLAEGPLDARTGARAVWTGTEVLLFGGVSVPDSEEQRTDGAAYDPATDTWRPVAGAPIPRCYEFGAVWTGTELVVLAGTFDTDRRRPVGAAYDPATDSWRSIADPPLAKGYAQDLGWDGTEVFAAYPVPDSTDDQADGTTAAAYDPRTDTWRDLPRPGTQPHWAVPVWTGDTMAFWDASPGGGAAYLADDETWVALPAVDGANREFPSLVWTGDSIIAWGGNDNCEAAGGSAADCDLAPLDDGHVLHLG